MLPSAQAGEEDDLCPQKPIIRAVGTYFSLSELAMMRHSGVNAVSPMSVYLGHSVRKACMGFVDAARRAGTKQAISVAEPRRMATITKVSQSAVPTP